MAVTPPAVAEQIDDYCQVGGSRYQERFLQELIIVAFSDPNDLMSYNIPPWFVDQRLDSQLCPKLANVVLDVAPVVDVFQFGAIANPLAAHANYDQDARVIELISHGIGNPASDEQAYPHCNWVKTI